MIHPLLEITRIPQRIARHFQGEKLIGFAAVQRIRHDPEFGGIESVQVAQESAHRRIEAVSAGVLRIIVALRSPGRSGFSDAIDLA
ncbi:MAG: hypothetical protein RKR03_19665 [Candidatus Competibacter sp.]|nr:hypothetical protein [Candidatus Competibacter sp.]